MVSACARIARLDPAAPPDHRPAVPIHGRGLPALQALVALIGHPATASVIQRAALAVIAHQLAHLRSPACALGMRALWHQQPRPHTLGADLIVGGRVRMRPAIHPTRTDAAALTTCNDVAHAGPPAVTAAATQAVVALLRPLHTLQPVGSGVNARLEHPGLWRPGEHSGQGEHHDNDGRVSACGWQFGGEPGGVTELQSTPVLAGWVQAATTAASTAAAPPVSLGACRSAASPPRTDWPRPAAMEPGVVRAARAPFACGSWPSSDLRRRSRAPSSWSSTT